MAKKRRLKRKVKIGLWIMGCVAIVIAALPFLFRTEKSEKQETIATLCIDPGHGGYDAGTIGADGSYEKDINLAIALEVGKQLEKLTPPRFKIAVVYTRTSDDVFWPENEEQDLKARVAFAKEQKADYYLSIHMNSNNDTSVYGYESYVREKDDFSQAVVKKIAENLDAAGWHYDRGTLFVEQYPLYVVSEQSIPSLLFEAGYMSNYQECTDLQKSKNQKIIAQGIAQAYIDQIFKDKNIDLEEE